MTNPSALLKSTQSLTHSPVAVFGGNDLTLTTIYASNVNDTDARYVHILENDGSTLRFALLVPPNFSGIVMTIEGGVRLKDGVKVAASTSKSSLSDPGTDVDVILFGRNA